MKVKGVSFSAYKVKLNTYILEKLDLFSFLFTQIILDENLDKNSKLVDCLLDLDIKEDLFYLFNNIYYKFIDNKIIEEAIFEDIYDVTLKDIVVDKRFETYLKGGYFPVLNGEKEKEFVYDTLAKKVVLKDIEFKDSNVCVVKVNNDRQEIEAIVNENKKGLLQIEEGICILKEAIIDPYYFEIDLKETNNCLSYNRDNKEVVYKALKENSLFISDNELLGEYLSSNIYFKCLYGDISLKDNTKYLFVYNKEKMGLVENNIIYVDYKLDEGDFIDLVNKEEYKCGTYLLENKEKIATFTKSRSKGVSEFKLYLIKNKDKFNSNIAKVIELI